MLAKIATTVDIVSGGRLDFGMGAGSRPSHPLAEGREYAAHGLPYHDAAYAVGSLAEACTVIRRLWTEDKPFDFPGDYIQLTGAFCNPKPVQRPHPPILIGGRSAPRPLPAGGRRARRRVEHAGRGHRRLHRPQRRCSTATAPRSAATPPRSPARCTCRSPYDQPARTRTAIAEALDMPASATSYSACRPPTRPAWPAGSPTSSSSPVKDGPEPPQTSLANGSQARWLLGNDTAPGVWLPQPSPCRHPGSPARRA